MAKYSEADALRVINSTTDLDAQSLPKFALALLQCLPNPPKEVKEEVVVAFHKAGWDVVRRCPDPGSSRPGADQLQLLLQSLLRFFTKRLEDALEENLDRVSSQQERIELILRTENGDVALTCLPEQTVGTAVRQVLATHGMKLTVGGIPISEDDTFVGQGIEDGCVIDVGTQLAWPSTWKEHMTFGCVRRGRGASSGQVTASILASDNTSQGEATIGTKQSNVFIEKLRMNLPGNHEFNLASDAVSMDSSTDELRWIDILNSSFVEDLCEEFPEAEILLDKGRHDFHMGGHYVNHQFKGKIGMIIFTLDYNCEYGSLI